MAVIEEGDTLVRLALRLGIPVSVLLQLNPEFATGLTVGATIRLPGTEPKRVGATVARPRVLPGKAPTTAGETFFADQFEGFERAYATFLDTIADPRIRKFMAGQTRLIEQEFLGRIGRSFLSGEIKDLTEAPDPLAFLKDIDPRARFFGATPFERGEQGFAPTALRPRRVRF